MCENKGREESSWTVESVKLPDVTLKDGGRQMQTAVRQVEGRKDIGESVRT